MIKRVTFSDQNLELYEIYDIVYKSLCNYLKGINNHTITENRFIGMTPTELSQYFDEKFKELEYQYQTSFDILSSVEAKFRIDYLQRIYMRHRDDLTRQFRELYKDRGVRASLKDEILELWKNCYPVYNNIISDYKGALKLRDWLAHGRYWVPKFGRKYDLNTVYTIAEKLYTDLPFCI